MSNEFIVKKGLIVNGDITSDNTGGLLRHTMKMLRPHEQATPDDTVRVEAGQLVASDGSANVDYAGGNSPSFAVVSDGANDRTDLLLIDDSGVLSILQGIEALEGTSVPVTYPTNKQVIAEVTVDETATVVINDADIKDVRPFLNLGGGAGGGGVGSTGGILPVGAIITHGSVTAPAGYLYCDGSSVATGTYPELFAAIGYSFGGSGANFNVPDFRGMFLRGMDDGEGVDPNAGTRTAMNTGGNTADNVGSVQSDEFKAHVHSEGTLKFATVTGAAGGVTTNALAPNTTGAFNGLVQGSVGSTGGDETRPVNAYVAYHIKYTAAYDMDHVVGYVHRGDNAAHDFLVGDLTTDGTWGNYLDLSSIIPDGASAVALTVTIQDGAVGSWLQFRKPGQVDAKNVAIAYTQAINAYNGQDLIVACDDLGRIEYAGANLAFTGIYITVKGWWFGADTEFMELDQLISYVDRGDPADADFNQTDITMDGAWRDLDLSAIVPAGVTGVALFVSVNDVTVNTDILFRQNGNSNFRAISRVSAQVANVTIYEDLIVPCDTDRVIEYNASSAIDVLRITVKGWFYGSSLTGAIDRTMINMLRPHEQTIPDMTVAVEAGNYIASTGVNSVDYAGGSSGAFVAPTSFPRIDILTINDAAVLGITQGTEAASPTPPSYPTDKQVLAEVTLQTSSTSITDAMIKDVRYFLNLGGGGGGGGGSVLYEEHYVVGTALDNYNGSTTVFDLLNNYSQDGKNIAVYVDGVKMRVGASYDYQETDLNTITFNYALVATQGVTFRWEIATSGTAIVNENRENYTATAAQTVFSLVGTYIANDENLRVYVDGILMTPVDDYAETSAQVVTFVSPMVGGEKVTFLYDKPSIDDVGVTERIERYVVGTAVDNYDGSLDVFDLLGTYQTDGTNMKVYYDGVLVDEGASNDYVETDNDTITFNYDLASSSIVTFRWLQYGVNALMVDEKRENHTATPAQTVFSLTYTYITDNTNLKVYVGGLLMRPVTDYTETDSSTVTFTNPMVGGEYVTFTHAIAAAGNATTVNGIHATRNPEANKLYPLDSNAMVPAAVTEAKFYDRGDPVGVDFDIGDLTTDSAWHDLDLSSIIPEGTKSVLLQMIINDSDGAGSWIVFRKNGNSNEANQASIRTQVANISISASMIVIVDSNGIIEYQAANLTWTTANITVCGWWK